jgi:hypothetical protein
VADVFRIVTIGALDGRARTVIDLQGKDVNRLVNSTQFTPGDKAVASAEGSSRYAGSVPVAVREANATIATVVQVRGAATDAARRLESVIATAMTANRELFIEWRPTGLTRSVFSQLRGLGSYQPTYQFAAWTANGYSTVQISWPVEPLPRGLPCGTKDNFAPPARKVDGLVNLIQNPNAAPRGQTIPVGWALTAGPSAVTVGAVGSTLYPAPGRKELNGGGMAIDLAGSNTGEIDFHNGQKFATGAAVKPGQRLACRARLVITRQFTFSIDVVHFDIQFTPAGGGAPTSTNLMLSGAALGTYAAGTVLDFTGLITVPAGAVSAVLQLYSNVNSGANGQAIAGQLMLTVVPATTTVVPAYGDGNGPNYVWAGTPGYSQSYELTEPKLAEYTDVSAPPAYETINAEGLTQTFDATGGGVRAFTSRAPVPDGEVFLAAYWWAGTDFTHVLSPGIKYLPDDGAYFYAAVENNLASTIDLSIYYFDGATHTRVATTTASQTTPKAPGSALFNITLRAEGDAIIAEYSNTPLTLDRRNFAAQVKFVMDETTAPAASKMGRRRAGYPMLRGRAPVSGTTTQIARFDWNTYCATDMRAPMMTLRLRDIPGTAPALLTPAVSNGSGLQAHGAIGWRQIIGNENYLRWGDQSGAEGWKNALPVGGLSQAPPGFAPGGVLIQPSSTDATKTATYAVTRQFRRGQPYTLSFWAKIGSGAVSFTISRTLADHDQNVVDTTTIVSAFSSAAWTYFESTFTPAVNCEQLTFTVKGDATGSAQLWLSVGQLYAGVPNDAPQLPYQLDGIGAPPPFGFIHATQANGVNRGGTTLGRSGFTLAAPEAPTPPPNQTIAGAPFEMVVEHSTSTQAAARLSWTVDPALIGTPDFVGDTIDVEVYLLAYLNATANVVAVLYGQQENDTQQQMLIRSREFGTVGRRVRAVDPTAIGSARSRLGTLALGRQGRWIIGVDFTYTTAAAGGYIAVAGIVILPTWTRAATPTGKKQKGVNPVTGAAIVGAPGGYPYFLPVDSSFGERITRPDGSGLQAFDLLNRQAPFPVTSIGGPDIELPPGDGEVLIWTGSNVFDALDVTATTDSDGSTTWPDPGGDDVLRRYRVDVTPRYRLMAPS